MAVMLLLGVLSGAAQSTNSAYRFTTLAGSAGISGSADGTGSIARFWNPYGVAADGPGIVYVADTRNHTVRKITPTGQVTTLVGLAGQPGGTDGTGNAARFHGPSGLAVDSAGNVYVADQSNHTIRKITPTGVVTTLAGRVGNPGSTDGTGSAARFNYPGSVTVDATNNLFVADTGNSTIRRITPGGLVTTLAGNPGYFGRADGTGTVARFYWPGSVAWSSEGYLLVADTYNHTIRKVTLGGVVTTLAGVGGVGGSADGVGAAAQFQLPVGLALDSSNDLFIADSGNHTIRKMSLGWVVTTLAGLAGTAGGADGVGSAARFRQPSGVTVAPDGLLYVVDYQNHTLRKGWLANPTPTDILLSTDSVAEGRPTNTLVGILRATDADPDDTHTYTLVAGEGSEDNDAFTVEADQLLTGEVFDYESRTNYSIRVRATDSAGLTFEKEFALEVTDVSEPPVLSSEPASCTLLQGGATTFSVSVSGDLPLSYRWRKDGVSLAEGTSRTYHLSDVQPKHAGRYSVVVSNAAGTTASSNAVLTVVPYDLAGALDTPGWTWVTGGDAPWSAQTNVTHDGLLAARSGAITNSQESWLETALRGPGFLTFWWKVSSEADYDFLEFYLDGVRQAARTSGEGDWQPQVVQLSSGRHTLRWRYVKDENLSAGQDGAWLDLVSFAPPQGPYIVTSDGAFRFLDLHFGFNINGPTGQEVVVETSPDLSSATWSPLWTNTLGSGPLYFSDPETGSNTTRYYRLRTP